MIGGVLTIVIKVTIMFLENQLILEWNICVNHTFQGQ